MSNDPDLYDLRLFGRVAGLSSFAATAREYGIAPTFVSKRIAMLEQTLGVRLLHRTTRRVNLTDEGRKVYRWVQRILEDVEEMRDEISETRSEPDGPIRISSSAKLGRTHLVPALSRFKRHHPGIDVWLELLDRPVDLIGEGFHLDIRAGEVREHHLIAHRIIPSARILFAAPSYVARHGMPRDPAELARHECVLLREREEPFGTWRMSGPQGGESVRVSGTLASNDIDVVLHWVRDGHGIACSADWLIRDSLDEGSLVRVLPAYSQPADVWAVSSSRAAQSARIRIFLEFLKEQMGANPGIAMRVLS